MNDTANKYQAPGWFTVHVFNPAVAAATRRGLSVWGSRILEIPGRRSGEPRRTPVNPLELGGDHYLVAPRGETQWVRNLRANGHRLVLIRGRRREAWQAVELEDAEKRTCCAATSSGGSSKSACSSMVWTATARPRNWPGSRLTTRSSG